MVPHLENTCDEKRRFCGVLDSLIERYYLFLETFVRNHQIEQPCLVLTVLHPERCDLVVQRCHRVHQIGSTGIDPVDWSRWCLYWYFYFRGLCHNYKKGVSGYKDCSCRGGQVNSFGNVNAFEKNCVGAIKRITGTYKIRYGIGCYLISPDALIP